MTRLLLTLALITSGWSAPAWGQDVSITDSGGPLLPEQGAYNVHYYDLDVRVRPETQAIDGRLSVQAHVVHPLSWFVLDLDTTMHIRDAVLLFEGAEVVPQALERRGGRVWMQLHRTLQPGDEVGATIQYAGRPRVAKRPPWDGGFTWAKTRDGQPWIATSLQGEGADLWWPCKDHPSDEPDSMAISIRVPEPLIAASNGRLRGVESHGDGTRTYHWFSSTPINNYNVALNIAPYRTLETTYRSVSGDVIPVTFWVLPEHYADGQRIFPQLTEHLAFYEKYLGPYPFRIDKYGVAETPYLGMEHQTIIAYGSSFDEGYDWLHHHELGHEWWGNLVTAPDWRDFWLHEGLCTYMQALFLQEREGRAGYLRTLFSYRGNINNLKPVAPKEVSTSDAVYFIDAERGISDNDIYYKGAWILHTLRYLIGDEAFFQTLRRMAYPDPAMENVTTGAQCRFASTVDFIRIAEAASGRDLDWFFEVYLHQPHLPRLTAVRDSDALRLRWRVPGGTAFPMPVDIVIDGQRQRVTMSKGWTEVALPRREAEVVIDPDGWLLMEAPPS